MLRRIEIRTVMHKISSVAEYVKAVRKAQRYPEHALVIGRKQHPDLFAEPLRSAADINGHVGHGLVINRYELLADPFGQWVESGSGSAGENDTLTLHRH